MLSFCSIFWKELITWTRLLILNMAYLLISSMYVVVHSCSKFTPILFCMTCLNNQSSEAVLYNMLHFREWDVFILQITSC